MTRKMATIRKIDLVLPIKGADAIECAQLGGWNVVIRKGEYSAGDLAIYCEIDSWIPNSRAPFLTRPDQQPHVYEGVPGERLRTVKLRGQLSQGLLLPMSCLTNFGADLWNGHDVSEELGILKWEAPIPANLSGDAKGLFPTFIPKTDQERIQNLAAEYLQWKGDDLTWEITEKLDGSSMTVFYRDGEFGVCSRNLELKQDEFNSMWKIAIRDKLQEKLAFLNRNLALQGEIIGEGIQKNLYKIKGQEFYIFDIYDIDTRKYFTPQERKTFITELGFKHVPVISSKTPLFYYTVADLIQMAEGHSLMGDIVGPTREGLVFKCNERQLSFKTISNKFLIKNGE